MFDIEKFARLARVKLTPQESKKIGHDLQDILGHFEELETVDTKNIKPMTGGTSLANIFREDETKAAKHDTFDTHKPKEGTDQFPETKNGYLKAPKIFD